MEYVKAKSSSGYLNHQLGINVALEQPSSALNQ
jgi:hypothetical protein